MVRKRMLEDDARRLLGGSPVAIVSTNWRGVGNAAPIAWSMPVSVNPPLIAIAVHPSRRTHDMIKFGEEFAINIPSKVLLNHTQWLGMVSNTIGDKLEASGVPTFKGKEIDSPLLEGCIGWIECTLHDFYTMGDHTLFIGKVVSAQADTDGFDFNTGMWALDDDEYKPLMYLGGRSYSIMDDGFDATVEQRPVEQMLEEGIGRELEEAEAERRIKREEEAERREEEERRGEAEPDTSSLPRELPDA